MRKIKWYLSVGLGPGWNYEGVIETEDDVTKEEIEDLVKEEAFNEISWGWEEVRDEI